MRTGELLIAWGSSRFERFRYLGDRVVRVEVEVECAASFYAPIV
jgi:hypothetical protein